MSDRFEDERYLNWLKLSLVLIYAKEALESFTDREVCQFHARLRALLPQAPGSSLNAPATCCACLKNQIKRQWYKGTFKCAANVCDKWIRVILQHHVLPRPQVEWENADVSQLPALPWECAKLFLPYGYQKQSSVQEFDLAAILTLYLNCLHFRNFFSSTIICEQVRDVRNKVMHSGQMKLETAELLRDVAKIKYMLQDPKHLKDDTDCQEAVRKIDQLMDDKLEVCQNKELELRVLNTTVRELEDKVGQLQNKYSGIDRELQTVSGDVDALKSDRAWNQVVTLELKNVKEDIVQLKNSLDFFVSSVRTNGVNRVDITRLLQCENKLTALNQSMEKQEQKLREHEQILLRHEQTLAHHGQAMTEQESSVADLREQQLRQATEQRANKRRLDSLENRMKQARTSDAECTQGEVQKLQQYLMDHYREIYLWSENPIVPEDEVILKDIYVDPDIRVLRERCDQSTLKDVQQGRLSEFSCKQIFQTGSYKNKQIYIVGDAGTGKSMFCKCIVNKWIKAHSGEEASDDEESDGEGPHRYTRSLNKQRHEERCKQKEEDRSILKDFTLLFCITLRDSMSECNVSEMIQSQFLLNSVDTRHLDAENILRKEKCLIILDGLDEWVRPEDKNSSRFSNPNIPGRDRLNKNVVILTTTRPWKLDCLRLKTSELDKHVELCGLGEKSAKRLSYKIVKMLNASHNCRMHVSKFLNTLEQKGLGHFKSVPVILIQLICLWFDKKGISESQVQLYGSMVDLLLERAEKHLPDETHISTCNLPVGISLPQCFLERNSCQLHRELLLCLSKLAFESLFNKKKEQSLVFPSSTAEHYGISQADIKLCLKCGILSQSKVLGLSSQRLKKFNFLHKKLQEFLAAIYIVTTNEFDRVLVKIKSICCTLESCLDFSKVFMFVSGLNADIARQLLQHFACIVGEDRRIQAYRQTLTPEDTTPIVQNIQMCYVECLSECLNNGYSYDDLSPQVEDFALTRDTVCAELELLLRKNSRNIKSMYINTKDIVSDHRQMAEKILENLDVVCMLEKLHVSDVDSVVSVDRVLNTVYNCRSTITCLVLWQVKLNKMVGRFSPLCSALTSLQYLRLEYVTLMHEQIVGLFLFISRHDLKDLRLWWLQCADHRWESCSPLLDLQYLSNLQTIQLSHMSVDNLHMLAGSVRSVVLSIVTVPVTTWRRFVEELSQIDHQVDVELRWVGVTNGSEYVDIQEELRQNQRLRITSSKFEFDGENCYVTFSSGGEARVT